MAADFRWRVCRLRFRTLDALAFPPHAGNTLRGVLGFLLDEHLFRPRPRAGAPSGFRTAPRPFVLRCASLDGRHFSPGSAWTFDLHLFDLAVDPWPAIRRLSSVRGARVEPLDAGVTEHAVDLTAWEPCSRLRVDFPTPTELKGHEDNTAPPPFDVLLKRARDRISALAAFYGEAPAAVDFRALGERAAQVRLTAGSVRPIAIRRTSSRTGETHPLGGFTGYAEYEGDIGEFVPWLKAAEAAGVGRHTVWGNGAIKIGLGL